MISCGTSSSPRKRIRFYEAKSGKEREKYELHITWANFPIAFSSSALLPLVMILQHNSRK
jgi:hypothetical protein